MTDPTFYETKSKNDSEVPSFVLKTRNLKLEARPNFGKDFDTTPKFKIRKQGERFGVGKQEAPGITAILRSEVKVTSESLDSSRSKIIITGQKWSKKGEMAKRESGGITFRD